MKTILKRKILLLLVSLIEVQFSKELMKVIEKISNINVTIGRIDLIKIHMIKLQILILQKVIIKIKSLFYVMMFLILEKH